MTILFTTPKQATPGAEVYYSEGGLRLFDYAPHVHEGGFFVGGFNLHTYTPRKYVDSYMNMLTWGPIIAQAIGLEWSRKR